MTRTQKPGHRVLTLGRLEGAAVAVENPKLMVSLKSMQLVMRTVKMPVVRMLTTDLSQATREATPEDHPTPQPRNLSGRTLTTVSKPTEGDDDTLTAQPNLIVGSSSQLNCVVVLLVKLLLFQEDQSLNWE